MVNWIHVSILILAISIYLPRVQSSRRSSSRNKEEKKDRKRETTEAPFSLDWGSSEEVVTTTPTPSTTPTTTTTTTTDSWYNYDYTEDDDFTTTTKSPSKSSDPSKEPTNPDQKIFSTTKPSIPTTTTSSKSKLTSTTTSTSLGATTTTTLPPKRDPTEKGVTTKPPTTKQPEVARPHPVAPPSSGKISFAREYADRSQNFLEKLKVELNYNQYMVAAATYLKAGEMLKFLQQNLTNLLGAECRKTEFPNFYQEHIPLPVSDQHHPAGSQENGQACTTSREKVNQKIRKFEQLIHANTKYQEQTTTVQDNLVKELESLHKSFQENLENTFGDYAHGEPHERLLSILREESPTNMPAKDSSVTKRSRSPLPRILKTPSIVQQEKLENQEIDRAPTPDTPPLAIPDVDNELTSYPSNTNSEPTINYLESADNFTTEVEVTYPSVEEPSTTADDRINLEFPVPPTAELPPQGIDKSGIEYIPAGSASIEAVESTGNETEMLSIPDQFERIEKLHREKIISEREKVDVFTSLIDQVEEAGLNENPEIFELAVLIKNCQGHTHIVPYVKHIFPAQVQHVAWGMKNHLKMLKNDTKFKVYADDDNNLQTLEILHDGNSNSTKNGDAWKFIPMNEGKSFVLYNIDRNSVLKVIPAQNAPLTWPTEAEVTMESAAGRDVTMLLKRSEYLWQLTLNCTPTEKDSASVERTRLVEKDLKCYVVLESQFYANLALNLNQFGYLTLQDNKDPGLFIVKNVN